MIFICNFLTWLGPQNFNKPSNILITHTHIDHIACLPFTMIGDASGNHIFNITAHAGKYYLKLLIFSLFFRFFLSFSISELIELFVEIWYHHAGNFICHIVFDILFFSFFFNIRQMLSLTFTITLNLCFLSMKCEK